VPFVDAHQPAAAILTAIGAAAFWNIRDIRLRSLKRHVLLAERMMFCRISSFFAIIWRQVSSGQPRSLTVRRTVNQLVRRLTLSRNISGVVVPKLGLKAMFLLQKTFAQTRV
jgi:hypothetical protein